MKSVKPGRGPSFMGGIGAVFMAFFGVIWTVMAANMGAPVFFVLFGVGFIILAVVWGVYHFHNAAGGNRFSAFDITEQGKEPDPLEKPRVQTADIAFCPACGAQVKREDAYCRRCGGKL